MRSGTELGQFLKIFTTYSSNNIVNYFSAIWLSALCSDLIQNYTNSCQVPFDEFLHLVVWQSNVIYQRVLILAKNVH